MDLHTKYENESPQSPGSARYKVNVVWRWFFITAVQESMLTKG